MTMTPGKRLKKRLQSFGAGKPIVLTKRDKEILADIDRFDVLTTEHISALHFASLHRTRKRMRKLWLHGFVKRWTRPVCMGEGSSPYLIAITPLGRLLIGSTKKNRVYLRTNQHLLGINTFRICVELGLRKIPTASIELWKQDRGIVLQTPPLWSDSDAVVFPDGHFVLTLGGKRLTYYLEIDRGTMDLTRIQAKFKAYLAQWKRMKDMKPEYRSFRVLVVTSSEGRLKNMIGTLSRIDNRSRRDIINVTASNQFSLTEPEKLFSPIWLTVDSYGNNRAVSPLPAIPILELPTVPSNSLVRGPDTGAR